MPDQNATSPDQALRNFLEVIADEAAVNTAFRNRLLMATGATVVFAGEEDLSTVDPVELVVRYDEATFRRIYNALSATQLKAVLQSRPNPALATSTDVRQKRKPDLLDMLWERARDRAEEKGRL
jgi:hypothetical protein